jgi:hypothetical protein
MMNAGKLADQQRRFAQAVLAAHDAPGLLDARRSRLHIYQSAYRARLIEALRSNYPVLHRVLGDDAFAELGGAYVDASPSRRPSIRWFGDSLAQHLVERPDALPHPALLDLVRMEWALGLSFDAADAPVLGAADLASIAPQRWSALRFEPHPSVALLALDWAVEPTWRSLTHDEDADADEPRAAEHALLVWRQGLETRWRTPDDLESALLRAALDGEAFAALCERALQCASERSDDAGSEAAARVAALLRRWIDDGLLSRVLA